VTSLYEFEMERDEHCLFLAVLLGVKPQTKQHYSWQKRLLAEKQRQTTKNKNTLAATHRVFLTKIDQTSVLIH
jgi:hypothetical protein